MRSNQIHDNTILLFADTAIYSKEAVTKCLYWYSDKFRIAIEKEDNCYNIQLKSLSNTSETELKEILIKIERDLLDYNLREIVEKETAVIRELLIAKAFSYEPND